MYLHLIRGVLIACMICALVAGHHRKFSSKRGRGRRDLFLTIQPLPQGNNLLRHPSEHNSEGTQLELSEGQGLMISAQSHNNLHENEESESKVFKAPAQKSIALCYEKPINVESYASEKTLPKEKEKKKSKLVMRSDANEKQSKWIGHVFRKPLKRKRRYRTKRNEKSIKDLKKDKETIKSDNANELNLGNAPVEPESKKSPMTQEDLDQVKFIRQKLRERNELKGKQAFAKIPEKLNEKSKSHTPVQPDRAEAGNGHKMSTENKGQTTTGGTFSQKEKSEVELEEKLPEAIDSINDLDPKENRKLSPLDSHSENNQATIETVNNALGKILTELDTIKAENPSTGPGGHSLKREGLVCNLTGSWGSEVAGARFDLMIESTGRLRVKVGDKTPACPKPLFNDRWLISGEAPFHAYGPFILKAYFKPQRRIGVFVGECRTCEGVEIITGQWILAHEARDCMDLILSREAILDVWRRDNIRQIQKRKLDELKIKNQMKDKKSSCSLGPNAQGSVQNHLHYKTEKDSGHSNL